MSDDRVMEPAPHPARRTPRAANARPTTVVLAELAEIERMIEIIRDRYLHAHDLAYSSGGGGGFEATGRSSIADSNPTELAALNEGKDHSRYQVARAGRAVHRAIVEINVAHSALLKAMPGADPYEKVWVPSDKDPIASRAENAAAEKRQQERAKRGEL